MTLKKLADMLARVAEQGGMDEVDGSGGALDVQQDCANLRCQDLGMYVGPMQSG